VKWYGKYRRKVSSIVKRYGKCGRKVSWIVKRYGNSGRKVSWKIWKKSKFYLFLLQNVPILQNAMASKSNHSNTMLLNVMVLAPLPKLKIKYELSYQSTTRLKYIDKFDQLLITPQWTSTVDNTVRSLIHLTIFYLIPCSKTFPIIYKIIIK
jgi:hypothetical protein